MGQEKEINIKDETYYLQNDMIDIRNFHSNLLKINTNSHKDIDIYNIVTSQLRSLVIVKIFTV